MTASTPILMRPTISALTLRSGEQAVAVSAAGKRIIVRAAHLDAFLTDLEEIEEGLGK